MSRPGDLKRSRTEDVLTTPTKRPRWEASSATTASQGNGSSEVNPVILADFPDHQDIWDRVPVGTLFELARLVQLKDINLNDVPRTKLERLMSTNVISTSQLVDVLGCGPTRVMEKSAAEALDFEAQSIVAGDGKMLEHEADKEIHGKVHFTAGLSLDALFQEYQPRSPTKSPSKTEETAKEMPILSLRMPRVGVSCLFSRTLGSHRFLRVKIQDRMRQKHRTDARLALLFEWARRPLYIFGRWFRAFVEKENTIWYYMEGPDYVGRVAENRKLPGTYGQGKEIPDIESLVRWWIPLECNQNQLMCKLTTRLHLGISGTRPGPMVTDVRVCKDVVRDVGDKEIVFTDGSGVVSQQLAIQIRSKVAANKPEPAAYQIRLSTSKGVVQVMPGSEEESESGEWIEITESMLKARHQDNIPRGLIAGMSILGAAHQVICVVKSATCRYPARLSAQIIPILSEQGVPLSSITALQERAVQTTVKELTIPTIGTGQDYQRASMAFAKAIQRYANLIYFTLIESQPDTREATSKQKFVERQERRWQLDDVISALDQEDGNMNHADMILCRNVQLYLAVTSGLNVKASVYFMEIWKTLVKKAISSATLSFKIEVPGSIYCTIVPDFTGELEEGQISFTPSTNIRTEGIDFTSGSVLVGRHPAYLPTDVRKVELANVPMLRERRGVIFFSTRGRRPLADLLAGGDYDGDDVILMWEPSLVEHFQNADDSLSEKPASVAISFERDAVIAGSVHNVLSELHDRPEERSRVLSEHLLGSLKIPQYLGLYNSYFIRAVHCHGIASEEARILGHKFNTLIDAPRTSFRLTTQAIMEDRKVWDIYEDPLWKRKKDEVEFPRDERAGPAERGKQILPRNRYNVLDELYQHGEKFYGDTWLEANGQNGRDAIFDPTQYERLASYWHEANRRVTDYPQIELELKLIEEAVKEAKRRFDDMGRIKSYPERNAKLIELAHWFANNPPARDVPLVTGVVDDVPLGRVRASYAYILDARTYSGGIGMGTKGGFCWMMAIAPLLSSISSSPVTISFPTFAKLTPHSSFCEAQEETDR